MHKQFEAFYYPYTAIHSIDSLKVALLYFDKIWILSPDSVYRGRSSFRSETQEIVRDLSNHNMVELVNPADAMRAYEDKLSSFIEHDLDYGVFRDLRGAPSQFRLYLSKIPRGILGRLSRKYEIQLDSDAQTIFVPFEFGESVILNHMLLSSSRYGLVPFTDERIHDTALRSKLRSIWEKYQVPSSEPIRFSLSLPAISGIDTSEILNLRESPVLESIRRSFRSLATMFQSESLSPPLWMAISKHLERIRNLGKQLQSRLKRVLAVTEKEAIVVRIPLTVSVYIAISLQRETFTLDKNTVSIFIDSQKLLPDVRAIRNIPEMLRTTIEGEPETVKSGSANLDSFLRILKKEED